MSPIARRISPRPPPRNLGSDRWQGRWLHLRRRLRRNAGRYGHGPASFQQGHQDRPLPIRKVQHFINITQTGEFASPGSSITEGIGQAASPQPRRLHAGLLLSHPDSERCRSSSIWWKKKASASAAPRASTSLAQSVWQRISAPGHTVVTILCDYGNRYQSKLFNPSFLEEKVPALPQWLLTNPISGFLICRGLKVQCRQDCCFRDDFYLSTCEATVTAVRDDGAIELDQTCFYATSGGQPGDTGFLERADGSRITLDVTMTARRRHRPASPAGRRAAPRGRRKAGAAHRLAAPLQADADAHRLPSPLRRLPLSNHPRVVRAKTTRASIST